jgi:hypothetical protein
VIHATPTIKMTPMDEGGGQTNVDVAIPELRDANNIPGVVYLRTIDPNTGDAEFQLSLPDLKGTWDVPLEVTYKPWINLVWVGVIVMGLGVFLAMVRRALEARKVYDGPLAGRRSRFAADVGDGDTPLSTPTAEPANRSSGKTGGKPRRAKP